MLVYSYLLCFNDETSFGIVEKVSEIYGEHVSLSTTHQGSQMLCTLRRNQARFSQTRDGAEGTARRPLYVCATSFYGCPIIVGTLKIDKHLFCLCFPSL